MSELSRLYEMQMLEAKLDRLRKTLKELPVYEEFRRLQAKTNEGKEAAGLVEGKLDEERRNLESLELAVQEVTEESRAVQARLYSGTVTSAKELSQLEVRAILLQRERKKAEDNAFLAMEAVEEMEKALASAREKQQSLMIKLHSLQKQGNLEISGIKEQIRECQEEREKLLATVSEKLLNHYRELQQRFKGKPLAPVEGEVCGGCRVSLSSNLKNRLCNPAAVVTCENCGRMLIPF